MALAGEGSGEAWLPHLDLMLSLQVSRERYAAPGEGWEAIPLFGAVYHTVNPRLFEDQIAWIVNHAEDRVMMTDLTFVPLLEKLADKLPTIERYVVLTDAAHMPQTSLKNAVPYEEWLAEADDDFTWKSFDENTAAGMCYTSGTTGFPKGAIGSHRNYITNTWNARFGVALAAKMMEAPVIPNIARSRISPSVSASMVRLPSTSSVQGRPV